MDAIKNLFSIALQEIPPEAENEKVFIIWEPDAQSIEPSVCHEFMAIWKMDNQWAVWGYYPDSDEIGPGWICNSIERSEESAINWVKSWMEDFAPEAFNMYFQGD